MRKISEPTLHLLDKGLRLVHLHDVHTNVGIFGLSVRAGSSDESVDEYGLAHFVEHTIFKGTTKHKAPYIINRMESIGGELNAYTTKEVTVIYTIFPGAALNRAAELVADLSINSQFPDEELEKEREVVIDEINSYLDSPADAVYDDFEDLFYPTSGLGHNILGTPESVVKLSSTDCRNFLKRYYHRDNVVVFYNGPKPASAVCKTVTDYFKDMPAGETAQRNTSANSGESFEVVRSLPIHQSHVVQGAAIDGTNRRNRYAAALFANILGGPGMNSLLNVELRERRGLVYTVEATTNFFSEKGLLTLYFGCDEEDRELCMKLCRKVYNRLASTTTGLTERQLARARKQYIGQLAIAGENRENRILAAARSVLFHGELVSDRTVVDTIESITPEDISTVAQSMLSASTLTFIPQTSSNEI